jgi:DNA primase
VLDWLHKRGISDKSISTFQLGFAAPDAFQLLIPIIKHDNLKRIGIMNDNFHQWCANRLIIPIKDQDGIVVGFSARKFANDGSDNGPKFVNSHNSLWFNKSALIFGLDTAKKAIASNKTAVVVEGYFDVIVAQQHGFLNTVSSMGTAITPQQVTRLRTFADNVILAQDGDKAGEQSAVRLISDKARNLSSQAIRIRVATVPSGLDPDDVINHSEEQWSLLIAKAAPCSDIIAGIAKKMIDSGKSKQAAVVEVAGIIKSNFTGADFDDAVSAVATALSIRPQTILTAMKPDNRVVESSKENGSRRAYSPIATFLREPGIIHAVNTILSEVGLGLIDETDFDDTVSRVAYNAVYDASMQSDKDAIVAALDDIPPEFYDDCDTLLATDPRDITPECIAYWIVTHRIAVLSSGVGDKTKIAALRQKLEAIKCSQ